jgi:hypothetical protein
VRGEPAERRLAFARREERQCAATAYRHEEEETPAGGAEPGDDLRLVRLSVMVSVFLFITRPLSGSVADTSNNCGDGR